MPPSRFPLLFVHRRFTLTLGFSDSAPNPIDALADKPSELDSYARDLTERALVLANQYIAAGSVPEDVMSVLTEFKAKLPKEGVITTLKVSRKKNVSIEFMGDITTSGSQAAPGVEKKVDSVKSAGNTKSSSLSSSPSSSSVSTKVTPSEDDLLVDALLPIILSLKEGSTNSEQKDGPSGLSLSTLKGIQDLKNKIEEASLDVVLASKKEQKAAAEKLNTLKSSLESRNQEVQDVDDFKKRLKVAVSDIVTTIRNTAYTQGYQSAVNGAKFQKNTFL